MMSLMKFTLSGSRTCSPFAMFTNEVSVVPRRDFWLIWYVNVESL